MSAVRNVTSTVGGSSIDGGFSSRDALDSGPGPGADQRARLGGMQALGRKARHRPLDDDRLDPRHERLGLVGGRLVAGDERDRHAMVQRDERVQAGLAGHDPVDPDLPDRTRVVGVRQDGALVADRAVVAHHEDGVEPAVEPLHHVERLVLPREVRRAAVELAGVHVLHRPVRVVHQELGRAAVGCPVDRGVHLVEQEPAAHLVLAARAEHLAPVDDARRPLDVGRDEDPHGATRGPRPRARRRPSPRASRRTGTRPRRLRSMPDTAA